VFKTFLRVATTFGVLLAGYAAYVHAFAILAGSLHPPGSEGERAAPRQAVPSKDLKEAMSLAQIAFGPDHWTVQEKQLFRIYNSAQGYWMYFRDYERLKDGKQILFTPFAMISASRGGKSMKIATSRSALVDLDKPFDLLGRPSSEGNIKVLHARLEGEVVLSDNKGTVNPADDTVVTGLTYIDYDDASLKIVGDDLDTVVIDDPLYRVVGKGLEIRLRPKEDGLPSTGTTTGFDGPESMILKRDVRVTIRDVGPSGVLPGNPSAVRTKEKTPLEVRSDGMMLIRLPKPRVQPLVGPPAPVDPTFAWFNRNVEVIRGKLGSLTDTLNCDKLFLTLVPDDKAASKPGPGKTPADPDDDVAGTSAIGGLTLKRAEATGPNVWLVSAAQGMKARCLELIHEKRAPEPDKTYLRGNASSKLIVWKTDIAQTGPEKGQVTSFTTIHTIDATIFDDGTGSDHIAIVARGPGDMETRPGLNKPVVRKAHWLDQLTWQSEYVTGKPGAAPTPSGKRILILTGDPGFTDIVAQSQLDANDRITVFLKPKAVVAVKAGTKAPASAEKANDPAVGSASFEIERLSAKTNVRLNAPNRKLVARDWLNAEFEPRPAPEPDPKATAGRGPAPSPGPRVSAVAASTPTPATGAAPANAAKTEPPKPKEPVATATADRVFAKILLIPNTAPKIDARDAGPAPGTGTGDPDKPPGGASLINGDSQRAEVDSALLRGKVVFHQDPAPDKKRGTDVLGEAVDIQNQGNDRHKFVVYNYDPKKPRVIAKDGAEAPLARVDTDEYNFRGEELIIDQAGDEAEIKRRGSITMMAASGLLSDKGLSNPPTSQPASPKVGDKPAKATAALEPAKKIPMFIEFTKGMKFHGRPVDKPRFPVARAEFNGIVHGETDESTFDCTEIMTVYFDRNIALVQPKSPERTSKKTNAPSEESKPEIAIIHLVKDVVVFNEKLDPESKETLQRQRIEGDDLTYDRRTGDFIMEKQSGIVYLYEREGENKMFAPDGAVAKEKEGAPRGAFLEPRKRSIIRTSGPGQPPEAVRRDVEAVGRNAARQAADLLDKTEKPDEKTLRRAEVIGRNAARGVAEVLDKARKPGDKKPLPPLVLTQIRFSRQMSGRFGTGKDSDKTEPRHADFHGDVEVMRGPVRDVDTIFDYDNRPATAQFITSQILRVVSEPSKADPSVSPRYLMAAWENVNVFAEDKIIQADHITYDSATSLFYAHGEEGKDILIAQQGQPGQPASVAPGQAMWYNAKTGQSQMLDPRTMFFIDNKTGARPKPVKPPDDRIKVRNPKRTKFRNLRGSVERQGFGANSGR
jgi:hypothetical protein